MDQFGDRVAVITGAASGIGRGLAGRFAEAGMRLVLADIEREPLAIAERELVESGAEVLAVQTDVSQRVSVEALATAAYDRFGAVHVLCNNAGVAGGGGEGIWAASDNDWAWLLGVNLMGVVHGLQAFVPRMLAGGEPGHIVNTSSVLGLSSGPGSVYGVTKHAVTRLTEGLYYDLKASGAPIGASVLCPGMIATNIISAERNRPSGLRDDRPRDIAAEMTARRAETQARFLEEGMPPDEVGAIVLEAIRDERFYILTHPQIKGRVETRMRDILDDRQPSPPPAPTAAG